jgi:hypothetical protein
MVGDGAVRADTTSKEPKNRPEQLSTRTWAMAGHLLDVAVSRTDDDECCGNRLPCGSL